MHPKLAKRVKRFNQHIRMNKAFDIWPLLRIYRTHNPELFTPAHDSVFATKDVQGVLELADSFRSTVYGTATEHYVANQFAELVRKYPFTHGSLDPEAKALSNFHAAEKRCERYNKLFLLRRKHGRSKYESFLKQIRETIQYIIGERPGLSWMDLVGFGPGANVGVHGASTNAARKLSSKWTCTASAAHYFLAASRRNLFMRRAIWPAHDGFSPGITPDLDEDLSVFLRTGKLEIVDYNKVEFVPKTAKTHRSIAIEPLGNSFLQKGVDEYMRLRLRRFGIDLRYQEPNSDFARKGSISPEHPYATIDLSAASDSISIELAREVLPDEWFRLLDSIRSKYYLYDGVKHRYSKFCSMGNGFCFPLQTLIFSAVCEVCRCGRPGKDYRVYGDDIIVPREKAPLVIKWLQRLGLRINIDKTFVDGLFRESCGGDWFDGQDVRPYVLDEPLDSLQKLIGFCNAISRNPLWSGTLGPLRDFVYERVPSELKIIRPFSGPVDTAFDSDGVEHLSSSFCRYLGNGVWRWTELLSRARSDPDFADFSSLEFPLQMYSAFTGAFALRRKTSTRLLFIKGAGATSQWSPADVGRHAA